MQKIDGGYVFICRKALSHLKAQISTRALTTIEVRGILAFVEMRSIRDAAEALRVKNKKGTALIPNYSSRELSKLTNLPQRVASKVFKVASSSNLFSSEKGKLVPVPRRIIRFLAKCEKRSTILVLLAYIERGLCLDKGKVKNAGTVKAAFIAETTGLSLRAVRLARKELLGLGILTPDTTKYQRKLNRDGAYFTINLAWCEQSKAKKYSDREGDSAEIKNEAVKKTLPVDNSIQQALEIAPPPIKNCTKIAPPIRDLKSSNELRNQKTQAIASNQTGVFSKQWEQKPNIRNVTPDDLKNIRRCEGLYQQACKVGLVQPSEASVLNFVAAAIRARSVDGEPPRVFMGILKKKLWHHITQADEDKAVGVLKKFREFDPSLFQTSDKRFYSPQLVRTESY